MRVNSLREHKIGRNHLQTAIRIMQLSRLLKGHGAACLSARPFITGRGLISAIIRLWFDSRAACREAAEAGAPAIIAYKLEGLLADPEKAAAWKRGVPEG